MPGIHGDDGGWGNTEKACWSDNVTRERPPGTLVTLHLLAPALRGKQATPTLEILTNYQQWEALVERAVAGDAARRSASLEEKSLDYYGFRGEAVSFSKQRYHQEGDRRVWLLKNGTVNELSC